MIKKGRKRGSGEADGTTGGNEPCRITVPLILTLVMAAGTILTRFLPFILFPDGKQMPRYVEYLGHVLPYATMGILVVYCLKGVSLFQHRSGFRSSLPVH